MRRIVLLLMVPALLLSCSVPFFTAQAPGNPPPPGPAAATDTPAPAALPPTDTVPPLPTDTATVAPTATLGQPMVTPIDQNVNCRFGPGVEYEPQGSGLLIGNSTQIFGKSADGAWWQIQDPSPPHGKCWVGMSVTTASGDLSGILVVAAPLPFVTDASIKVSPSIVSVPGCVFPGPSVELTWSITVNGPVTVKYRLEILGDTPTDTMTFTKFGTQSITDSHHSGPADDSVVVKLVILTPNSMTSTDTFKVVCS